MEVLPAYLFALSGDHVHILTANAYLAERDFSEMSPVFEALEISVGLNADCYTSNFALKQRTVR